MDIKSKEFQDQQAIWYKKLKDSGFDDVEQDEERLKNHSTNFFRNNFNETAYTANLNYYRLAGQFLHDHKFQSKKERLIWELHSEGHGRAKIVEYLKQRRFKTYAYQVQHTIERLTKEMINKCK